VVGFVVFSGWFEFIVWVSGICGSELYGFRSVGFCCLLFVMGYEFVGLMFDGRRVVVNFLISCGECDLCLFG